MNKLLLLILFAGLQFVTISQTEDSFEEKMRMDVKKDYSWGHKNVFLEISISPFTAFQYREISDSILWTNNQKYERTESSTSYSLFSFSFNPRFNLVAKNDFAIYLKSAASVNFSFHRIKAKLRNEVTGSYLSDRFKGFGHFEVPIYIGYAWGLNSSYSNCDRNGFAIGVGYQVFKRWSEQNSESNNLTEYEMDNLLTYPVVRLDYYKLLKSNKLLGLYMGLGFYDVYYINIGMNFNLSKK